MNDGRIYIQEELKSRNAPREGDFIGDGKGVIPNDRGCEIGKVAFRVSIVGSPK